MRRSAEFLKFFPCNTPKSYVKKKRIIRDVALIFSASPSSLFFYVNSCRAGAPRYLRSAGRGAFRHPNTNSTHGHCCHRQLLSGAGGLRSSYTMRTKCAISDAFVRDCVFAYCASVAQYVYSLSAEHCFRLRNNAISDERVRDCALRTHSVAWPLVAIPIAVTRSDLGGDQAYVPLIGRRAGDLRLGQLRPRGARGEDWSAPGRAGRDCDWSPVSCAAGHRRGDHGIARRVCAWFAPCLSYSAVVEKTLSRRSECDEAVGGGGLQRGKEKWREMRNKEVARTVSQLRKRTLIWIPSGGRAVIFPASGYLVPFSLAIKCVRRRLWCLAIETSGLNSPSGSRHWSMGSGSLSILWTNKVLSLHCWYPYCWSHHAILMSH